MMHSGYSEIGWKGIHNMPAHIKRWGKEDMRLVGGALKGLDFAEVTLTSPWPYASGVRLVKSWRT